jgi:hypothetical protein
MPNSSAKRLIRLHHEQRHRWIGKKRAFALGGVEAAEWEKDDALGNVQRLLLPPNVPQVSDSNQINEMKLWWRIGRCTVTSGPPCIYYAACSVAAKMMELGQGPVQVNSCFHHLLKIVGSQLVLLLVLFVILILLVVGCEPRFYQPQHLTAEFNFFQMTIL